MMLWRIVVFVFIVYLGFKLYRLFTRNVRKGSDRPGVQGRASYPTASEMVKDPICGVYISPAEAVTLQTRGATLYFCSEECYRRFLETKG